MRIIVTGSEGFIGKRVVERLKRAGHEVEPFDQAIPDAGHRLRSFDWFVLNQSHADVVIHLAAVEDAKVCAAQLDKAVAVNVGGTAAVVEQCWRHKMRLIYASTTDAAEPSDPYAITKAAGEALVLWAVRERGLSGQSLRFGKVDGGRAESIAAAFVVAAESSGVGVKICE